MPSSSAQILRRIRRLFAMVLVLVLALAGVTLSATSASAAGYGPSYDGPNGHLGAYEVAGVYVYCLEIEKARPVGATSGPVNQVWGSLTPLQLARLNHMISSAGQLGDRRWTA